MPRRQRGVDASAVPAPVYFLDRGLGKRVLAMRLREAGLTVEVCDDHFPQDATDVEWLTFVGARGWVAITKDDAIRRTELEREALRDARVRLFAFPNAGVSAAMLADSFLHAEGKIRRLAHHQEPPFIARIHRDGTVTLLWKP